MASARAAAWGLVAACGCGAAAAGAVAASAACRAYAERPSRVSSSVTLQGTGARGWGRRVGCGRARRASSRRKSFTFFVRHLSKRLHSPKKTRRERVCSVLLTLRERHGVNGCVNAPIMLRADTARTTDTVSTHPHVEERLNVTPLVYLVSRRRTRRTRSAPANIVATNMWWYGAYVGWVRHSALREPSRLGWGEAAPRESCSFERRVPPAERTKGGQHVRVRGRSRDSLPRASRTKGRHHCRGRRPRLLQLRG